MENSSSPAIKRSHLTALILGALAIILFRSPLWYTWWTRDEGQYGIGAQEILLGHLPYTTYADHKGPLVYYFYALPLAITSPDNYIAIRVLATLCFVAGALVLYAIGRRLAGDAAGLAAFFLYGTAALGLRVEGFVVTTELLMALPLMFFYLYLLKGEKRDLVFSGLWCGTALLVRQTAGLYFCAGLLYLVISSRMEKKGSPLSGVLAMIAGFLIPPLITVAVYSASGALHDLYIGYVFNNIAYIKSLCDPLQATLLQAFEVSRRAFLENPLFFAAPLIVYPLFMRHEPSAGKRLFITLFLLVSLYVSFSTKIYPRSLMQLLPLWALVGACGVAYLGDRRRAIIAGTLVAILAGSFISAIYPYYFRPMDKEKFTTLMPEIFVYSEELGKALRDASKPSDAILNWGCEYEMTFFTLRGRGMKYQLFFLLYMAFAENRGDHFFLREFTAMQHDALKQIYANPPRFIVVTAPFFTYNKDVYFLPVKVEELLKSRYRFIGVHKDSFYIYKLNPPDTKRQDSRGGHNERRGFISERASLQLRHDGGHRRYRIRWPAVHGGLLSPGRGPA
jgi:hypothetical protein